METDASQGPSDEVGGSLTHGPNLSNQYDTEVHEKQEDEAVAQASLCEPVEEQKQDIVASVETNDAGQENGLSQTEEKAIVSSEDGAATRTNETGVDSSVSDDDPHDHVTAAERPPADGAATGTDDTGVDSSTSDENSHHLDATVESSPGTEETGVDSSVLDDNLHHLVVVLESSAVDGEDTQTMRAEGSENDEFFSADMDAGMLEADGELSPNGQPQMDTSPSGKADDPAIQQNLTEAHEQAQEAAREASKPRKRKRKDNDGRHRDTRSRSRTARANQFDWNIWERRLSKLEMPARGEFENSHKSLNPKHYKWALPPAPVSEEDLNIPKFAPAPTVPGFDDDSEDPPNWQEELLGGGRHRHASKRPPKSEEYVSRAEDDTLNRQHEKQVRRSKKEEKRRRRAARQAEEADMMETEPVETGPQPASLGTLPSEVRQKIFKELLVHNEAINVFDGWRKIYRRNRHELHPKILQVCRVFFWEGIRVLYGENKFKYKLRDAALPNAPAPADVEGLAHDDDRSSIMELDNDNDNDPDYQEPGQVATASRRSTRNRNKNALPAEPEIHIAKYFSLFRHLILEAEHNRYNKATMNKMAEAVQVFVDPPELENDLVPINPLNIALKVTSSQSSKKKSRKGETTIIRGKLLANIHTLTIRVHPQYLGETEEGVQLFTFAPFFSPGSSVTKSLKELLPQFIRIDVESDYLDPDQRSARLMIDMRPQRIACRVAAGGYDDWAGDHLMQWGREFRANRSNKELDGLEQRMLDCCKTYLPEEGVVNEFDVAAWDLMWADDELDIN